MFEFPVLFARHDLTDCSEGDGRVIWHCVFAPQVKILTSDIIVIGSERFLADALVVGPTSMRVLSLVSRLGPLPEHLW